MNVSVDQCHAQFDGRRLIIGNALVERSWQLIDGAIFAESLRDIRSGREWLRGTCALPSLTLPAGWAAPTPAPRPAEPWCCEARRAHGLEVELTRGQLGYRFRIFPQAAGVSMQLIAPPQSIASQPTAGGDSGGGDDRGDALDSLQLAVLHAQLVQVTLKDGSDVRDNLVFEQRWLPHPAEEIRLAGNLFFIEDRLSGDGVIFLKHAPLPHARPIKCDVDFEWTRSGVRLLGHGLDNDNDNEPREGYECVTLLYRGGRTGGIAALQSYQRQVRPLDPARDGLLLSNTWGDRSKDGRIGEGFMLREIEAAARLGVDVVQLDDGWQRGVSGGSVVAGGRWTAFWDHDPHFWQPHPERFPHGLTPIVAAADRHGLKVGLWYAPDSSESFQNWRRDADQILHLHRAHGIEHFKIDAVKMHTPLGQRNLHRFFDAVRIESGGKICFDLDITAAVRPGYFGATRDVGALFVENRYTDWHNYWPHATLRNLWQLSHYLDPLRLRMEFLNNQRNAQLYGDDPLAPHRYPADYLFASVMLASPLAWFEISGVTEEFIREVEPLVRTWKAHRREFRNLSVIPIGAEPDGTSLTGFAACDAAATHGYLLLFRELNERPTYRIELPMFPYDYHVTALGGRGRLEVSRGCAQVEIATPLQFLFARLVAAP